MFETEQYTSRLEELKNYYTKDIESIFESIKSRCYAGDMANAVNQIGLKRIKLAAIEELLALITPETKKSIDSVPVSEASRPEVALRQASFIKGTELLCDYCDATKVYSDKPETGQFFSREGFKWDFLIDAVVGDHYVRVIWAVCARCLADDEETKTLSLCGR